jgi:hypothetical protein
MKVGTKSQRQSPRGGDKSQTRKSSFSPSYPKAPIARVSDPDLVDCSLSNGDAGSSKKVSWFFVIAYELQCAHLYSFTTLTVICMIATILLVAMFMHLAVWVWTLYTFVGGAFIRRPKRAVSAQLPRRPHHLRTQSKLLVSLFYTFDPVLVCCFMASVSHLDSAILDLKSVL